MDSSKSKRAAIYCRAGNVDRLGLEEQKEVLQKLCGEKGLDVIEQYDDVCSANTPFSERPALSELLKSVNAGCLDYVFVAEYARLTRNAEAQLMIEMQFDRAGVKIVVANGEPFISLLTLLRGFLSQAISSAHAERVRQGMLAKFPPYGYFFLDGKLVSKGAEVNIVRMIYEMYVIDKLNIHKFATKLNELGYHNRAGRSTSWSVYAVRKILTSKAYEGLTDLYDRAQQVHISRSSSLLRKEYHKSKR